MTSKRSATAILRRLGALIAEDRAMIWLVVAFAVLLGVLGLATPVAVQSLVNFVAFGGLMQPLIVVAVLLFFFLAFGGAVRVLKSYVVEILQRRLFFRVARSLADRLPRVRLESHDRGHGPELVNRFFDVLTIQKTGSTLLLDGLDIVLQSTIGLVVLAFYHPFLLVFDAVLIAAIAFVLFGLGRGAIVTARDESAAKYAVAAALEEIAGAPTSYKSASAARYARTRLVDLTEAYLGARKRHYGVVLRQLGGAVTLHAVAATGLLTLGGVLVIRGQLTLGQLVAAELIVSLALVSFVKFGKKLESFYDLLAGVEKLSILFDLPLDEDRGAVDEMVEAAEAPRGAGELELRECRYAHHARAASLSAPSLRGFSLRVLPGERVAITGRSASGKTTLAELAAGLRRPSGGAVLLDGVDVRDLPSEQRARELALVTGGEWVDGSVLDNVRFGREISERELRDMLERLGISGFLASLPDGMHTRLRARAAPLPRRVAASLALARALVRPPRVLIVDDLLDVLDGPGLERALAVLAELSATTLIVMTSRARVARAMQRQVRLQDPVGSVVEVGGAGS